MTEDALIRAVLDAPDDDVPRLIYADWLDDHGQAERAEFIRVQIELARLGEPANQNFGPVRNPRMLTRAETARRKQLDKQANELLEEHGKQWLAKLPTLKGIEWGKPHRGFIESVRVDSFRTFRTHAARLFDLIPLQTVQFVKDMRPDSAARLAEFPALARLRHLVFHGSELGDRGATALARSPHVANLLSLEMSMSMVDDLGATALAYSTYLANLQALMMYMNRMGNSGVSAIARSTTLRNLVVLNLELNHITDRGARAFAETKQLPALLHLNLSDQFTGDLSPAMEDALRQRWGDRIVLD